MKWRLCLTLCPSGAPYCSFFTFNLFTCREGSQTKALGWVHIAKSSISILQGLRTVYFQASSRSLVWRSQEWLLAGKLFLSITERLGKGSQEIVGPREEDQSFNWLERKRDLLSKDGPANEGKVVKRRPKHSALEGAKLGQLSTKDLLADYFIF